MAAITAGSIMVNKTILSYFRYLRPYLRSSIKLTGFLGSRLVKFFYFPNPQDETNQYLLKEFMTEHITGSRLL